MTEKDPINPGHYKSHPSGVECIEITRHMGFNIGNAIKYLWRSGQKGSAIEDLKKAAWYIQDEIQRLQRAEAGEPLHHMEIQAQEGAVSTVSPSKFHQTLGQLSA